MKYTREQLKLAVRESTLIETYQYTGIDHRIHTDTVKYIGNSNFDNSEIDELPFDENGFIEADVFIMDEEDYSRTILANTSTTWADMFEPDDKVAVIVI